MISSTRPKKILEAIEKERVTTMILVVAQLQQMVDDPDLSRYDLSSLQVVAGAGSHVPAELIHKITRGSDANFTMSTGVRKAPVPRQDSKTRRRSFFTRSDGRSAPTTNSRSSTQMEIASLREKKGNW